MFRRNVMLYDTIRIYLLWRNEASYENRIYRGDTGKSQNTFAEMHKYYEQRYTPKVKTSKKCNACSLKDI